MEKLKAVAYARYSSDNQREESIDAQLRAIRKYAAENNIMIIKIYVDRAMTARSDKRPEFQQMIMDSRKGIFDAVIIHKLNRFSRNKYDAAKYKQKLLKNNVSLISNEETKPIIKFIYKSYLNGYGYNWIMDELNKAGYKTAKGNEFNVSSIKDILKNEKYIGTYVYNKAIAKDNDGKRNSHKTKPEEDIVKIQDGMPSIISKKDFYAIQDIMQRNIENHNTFNAKEIYLLSGLIYCGECGNKIVGNISYYKKENEKLKYIMYRCNNREPLLKGHSKSIKKEVIENYIIHEMENIISAVSEGNKHKSLMDRLTKLEEEKEILQISIEEVRLKCPVLEPISEKYLKNIFYNHKRNLTEKNMQLIKKFINLYIEKVLVYDDHIKVVFKLSPLLVECSYGEPVRLSKVI